MFRKPDPTLPTAILSDGDRRVDGGVQTDRPLLDGSPHQGCCHPTNLKRLTRRTATFAAAHMTTAFLVAWAVTGSPLQGGMIALLEPLCNVLVYYVHERVWLRTKSST